MARINIEDELFKDTRFTDLCIELRSRRMALGALVEAWVLSQKFVSPENPSGAIPEAEWINQNIAQEIITAKLACRKDGFIEMSGGKKHFSWLVQRQVAAQKGGEANAKNFKEPGAVAVLPEPTGSKIKPTGSKNEPTGSQNEPNGAKPSQTKPSYSFSSSSSFSSSGSNSDSGIQEYIPGAEPVSPDAHASGRKRKRAKLLPEESSVNRQIWDAYKGAIVHRYKDEPVRNATVNTQIDQLRKRLGGDAVEVVKFYVLKHHDSFYVSKTHSIGLCLRDAETLFMQWKKGKAITKAMVRNFDKTAEHHEMMNSIEEHGI